MRTCFLALAKLILNATLFTKRLVIKVFGHPILLRDNDLGFLEAEPSEGEGSELSFLVARKNKSCGISERRVAEPAHLCLSVST